MTLIRRGSTRGDASNAALGDQTKPPTSFPLQKQENPSSMRVKASRPKKSGIFSVTPSYLC